MARSSDHGFALSTKLNCADTRGMPRLWPRRRFLDLAVTLVAVGLCAAPFVPAGTASFVETPVTVDQRVKAMSLISMPQDGAFTPKRSGRAQGSVAWDVYTSDSRGFKLVVSSPRSPAMRETRSGTNIADYGDPRGWAVGRKGRAFGFSATGSQALSGYSGGKLWRGFKGQRGIEIARRRQGATPVTKTTLKLTSEMGEDAKFPADARLSASVTATVLVNI
jgi:hypothetical protein